MPSQNFCNPDHCSNSCVLSVHVVHQGGGLAHQGEGLVHQGQGLLHHGEGQQDPTGTLRRLPHPRHDCSILRHHSKDKTSAQRVGFSILGRVLEKIWGSGSGSGRVGMSKYTIVYFRVSFLLSGISGISGYFRVFLGLPNPILLRLFSNIY